MPPKLKPVRKQSATAERPSVPGPSNVAQRDVVARNKESAAMPPPPRPVKPPGILEPEVDAMAKCLKNASVHTGQIYKFYADAIRLGVKHHVVGPPRSMADNLASELGKYDQLCDSVETQLQRAIAVLQRDLDREETRLRIEAEKAAALELEAKRRAEALKDIEMVPLSAPPDESSTEAMRKSQFSPSGPSLIPLHRRQSKVSLSTLHRSPFPLKLDLSTMRMGEDAGIGLGMGLGMSAIGTSGMGIPGLSRMASPVQLASARQIDSDELNPDLFAALAGQVQMMDPSQSRHQHMDTIDLTMDDASHGGVTAGYLPLDADKALGNSADKPIELDLDTTMSDIFGEGQQGDNLSVEVDVEALFSPTNSNRAKINLPSVSDASGSSSVGEGMELSLLNVLSQDEEFGDAEDLMASLGGDSESQTTVQVLASQATAAESTLSPNSIIARLTSANSSTSIPSETALGKMPAFTPNDNSRAPDGSRHGPQQSFDLSQLDMSNFGQLFTSADTGMEELRQMLSMAQGVAGVGSAAGSANGSGPTASGSGSGDGTNPNSHNAGSRTGEDAPSGEAG